MYQSRPQTLTTLRQPALNRANREAELAAACSSLNPSRWHRTMGARYRSGRRSSLCVDHPARRFLVHIHRQSVLSSRRRAARLPACAHRAPSPCRRPEARPQKASSPASQPGGRAGHSGPGSETSPAKRPQRRAGRPGRRGIPQNHRPMPSTSAAKAADESGSPRPARKRSSNGPSAKTRIAPALSRVCKCLSPAKTPEVHLAFHSQSDFTRLHPQ